MKFHPQKNYSDFKPVFFQTLFLTGFFSLYLWPVPTRAQVINGPELNIKINETKETVSYQEYSSWISFEPSLIFDSHYRSEIENINNQTVESYGNKLFLTQRQRFHWKKTAKISLDSEKIATSLQKISEKINQPAQNATFKIDSGRVQNFTPEKNGLALDQEKSLGIIQDLFEKNPNLNFSGDFEVELAYKTLEPEIKSGDANDLGIETLIGQGKSDFKGSTRSRIHNIKTALTRYDGLLIAPGEEFSFVENLGEVDGEHGYLPELVIKNDKTEPEFGGGICQVSTTAFRAAIYSGLEITARKNHAYPVSYYNPQGMDATIYVPKPDLKFINNTPGYILIQTEIEGTQLTFNFYGTNDGRKVEVDGPHILERNSDGSMKTAFTQKVLDENGKEIINETFSSFYDSPNKYPHPGSEPKLTEKPKDWSNKQWDAYKKANGI